MGSRCSRMLGIYQRQSIILKIANRNNSLITPIDSPSLYINTIRNLTPVLLAVFIHLLNPYLTTHPNKGGAGYSYSGRSTDKSKRRVVKNLIVKKTTEKEPTEPDVVEATCRKEGKRRRGDNMIDYQRRIIKRMRIHYRDFLLIYLFYIFT